MAADPVVHERQLELNRQYRARQRAKAEYRVREAARGREYRARLAADPERYERHRKQENERNAKARKALRADVERHREYKELRRIDYRLRLEQEGRELDAIRALRIKGGLPEDHRVDVALLRGAVVARIAAGELTMSDAARRCGYINGNGRVRVDSTQLKRNLGLAAHTWNGGGFTQGLRWETAAHIARSLDIDPQEVGL